MLSEILKKKGANILSKQQQRHVVGGYHNGGPCHVFWRPGGPGTPGQWLTQGTTVATAQRLYRDVPNITGYCCASCNFH